MKYFPDKIISISRIIAPQQLPPLYRLTLLTLFAYIVVGTASLAYKNIVLLESYKMTEETKELKKKADYYASNLELAEDKDFLDSYYREYFSLTEYGETLLLITQ